MANHPKRRRLNDEPKHDTDTKESLYTPLTQSQKDSWHGFCEIESEPALFNVMLRRFGVEGVKVQEVISLDGEMLGFLHQPVYGLIFLFRWKEDDPVKQEQSCPEGIWFANQTVNYACASVALLNIVNNIDGLELGEQLKSFKEFTKDFTPALRGDAIGNFQFVKEIHNSFARKMDVLTADLQLKGEATTKRSKSGKKNQDNDDSEAGFHFIAFVHAKDTVWKFDGLERQPQSLGECSGDDWLALAKPEILSRMAGYEEDQIEFSILSLAKDPMVGHVADLGSNVKSFLALNEQLSHLEASNPEFANLKTSDPYSGTLYGPDPSYHLTQDILDRSVVPEDITAKLETQDAETLSNCRRNLDSRQKELRFLIKEEEQSRRTDEDYAESRTHDYAPAIRHWVQLLARKGVIEELAQETLAAGGYPAN